MVSKVKHVFEFGILKQEALGCFVYDFIDSRVNLFGLLFCSYNHYTAGLPMSYKLGPRWDDFITWSDFKSETIFGFLSPNYTGQCT